MYLCFLNRSHSAAEYGYTPFTQQAQFLTKFFDHDHQRDSVDDQTTWFIVKFCSDIEIEKTKISINEKAIIFFICDF